MAQKAKKSYPKVCNLSAENTFFVGRNETIQDIKTFFKNNKSKILSLTGGPGFGKTQIAQQYAHREYDQYDVIWRITPAHDLAHQFEELATHLNTILPEKEQIFPAKFSKEALIHVVTQTLQNHDIRYLLIFDNALTYKALNACVPIAHGGRAQHILMTSRNANIWTEAMRIGPFKRSESREFIKKILPKATPEAVEKLAKTLHDHPLGLAIAVGVIHAHPTMDIDQYVALHVKRKKLFLPSHPLLDGYTADVETALSISLEAIANESQEAIDALFFMSLLSSKDIPKAYIDIWLRNKGSDLIADEAIRLVYEQSLIDKSAKLGSNSASQFLSLHDLIHQITQESIPMKNKHKHIETTIKVMLEVFAGPSEDFTKKIIHEPIHLLHAQELCETAKKAGYSSPSLLTLKICIFHCLMSGMRDCKSALKVREEIEGAFKTGMHVEPYYEGLFKLNQGFLEGIFSNFDAAVQSLKESATFFETSEAYKNELLFSLNNLMQICILRGELEEANVLFHRAEKVFKGTTSIAAKSLFLYASACLLLDKSKFQDAENVLKQSDNYAALAEDNPPIHHAILFLKTISLLKQKKLEEAQDVLKAYEVMTDVFFQGRNNSAIPYVLVSRSFILMEKGELSPKIFHDLEQALSSYKELFKGDGKHRLQARAYFAIGKAHHLKGEFDKALKSYFISNEIYARVLKNKRIDDVSELYTALAILGMDLKDNAVTSRYLKTHIETFGADHPRTREILSALESRELPLSF